MRVDKAATARLLVYRALGVPDVVVDPGHRREAAAWHLGRLASVPLSDTDPAQASHFIESLSALIDAVVDDVAAGHLDEVLGNYGFMRELSFWADQTVLTHPIAAHPDDLRHWSAVLFGCLLDFVASHPFGAEIPTNVSTS